MKVHLKSVQSKYIYSTDFCPHLGTHMCKTSNPTKNAGGSEQSQAKNKLYEACCSYGGRQNTTKHSDRQKTFRQKTFKQKRFRQKTFRQKTFRHSDRQSGDYGRGQPLLTNTLWWVFPCRVDGWPVVGVKKATPPQEIITSVLLAAKIALTQAEGFKEKFVQRTFHRSWEGGRSMSAWKEQGLDWLPSKQDIPKDLGEEISKPALLNLETALNRIHNYMQRFAVGLQLIVEDRAKYKTKNKNFLTEFNEAQYKLKEVLCELKEGILGRGLKVGVNVDRSIISWEIRKDAAKEPAYRNLRDWYIYRDYMNGLEYVIHAFDHLKKHHQ